MDEIRMPSMSNRTALQEAVTGEEEVDKPMPPFYRRTGFSFAGAAPRGSEALKLRVAGVPKTSLPCTVELFPAWRTVVPSNAMAPSATDVSPPQCSNRESAGGMPGPGPELEMIPRCHSK
jgi:hypothetical protein